jgi:hypothetical protein
LVHVLQTERVGALVLPARSAAFEPEDIVTLLDQVSVPTFVVR